MRAFWKYALFSELLWLIIGRYNAVWSILQIFWSIFCYFCFWSIFIKTPVAALQLDSEILLRGQFESLKKKIHPVILYPFPSRGSSVTYGCLSKKNTLLFDEGPLTCWMSVLRVPSLAGCQFLEGPLTCLDVMWSLFWSKLDLKMKIWPTSGRFGENCLLKLVLVCLILTQWWNKKNDFTSPLSLRPKTGDWRKVEQDSVCKHDSGSNDFQIWLWNQFYTPPKHLLNLVFLSILYFLLDFVSTIGGQLSEMTEWFLYEWNPQSPKVEALKNWQREKNTSNE